MSTSGEQRRAAFIDRDGVINRDSGYVHRPEDFVLLPGAVDGLRRLKSAGFLLIVVTNQAGVARGYYDVEAVDALHEHMKRALESHDVRLDAVYHCPHHPDGVLAAYSGPCDCRKPAPGMLLTAAWEWRIDLARSAMVGDKESDIEAGRRANVQATVRISTDPRAVTQADCVADNLESAARFIIALEDSHG